MAHFHRQLQLAYLAHPRTASNATVAALQTLGFESEGHHNELGELEGGREAWTVFTAVRNPYDLAVSWVYHMHPNKRPPEPPWPKYIFEAGIGERNSWIRDHHRLFWFLDDADHVLRFETLQDDLDALLPKIGLPRVELPVKNVSECRRRRPYQMYFKDQEAIDYVTSRLRFDIEDLGYAFDWRVAA